MEKNTLGPEPFNGGKLLEAIFKMAQDMFGNLDGWQDLQGRCLYNLSSASNCYETTNIIWLENQEDTKVAEELDKFDKLIGRSFIGLIQNLIHNNINADDVNNYYRILINERNLPGGYLFPDGLQSSIQYGLHTCLYDERIPLFRDQGIEYKKGYTYIGRFFSPQIFIIMQTIFWEITNNLLLANYTGKKDSRDAFLMKSYLHYFRLFYLAGLSAENIFMLCNASYQDYKKTVNDK